MITNDVTSQGVIVQPECKHRCKLRIIVYSRFIFMIGEFSIFPLHGFDPNCYTAAGFGFDPN